MQATGTFETKMSPLPDGETLQDLTVTRMAIDKQFDGDFKGSSRVEMMAANTSVKGSAAYVAVERATGSLKGRKGSFTLVHKGVMRAGSGFDLSIQVVPDSATGELAGLSGSMQIIIEDGKHSYVFDYALPDTP